MKECPRSALFQAVFAMQGRDATRNEAAEQRSKIPKGGHQKVNNGTVEFL
jgi:hypothetical protein